MDEQRVQAYLSLIQELLACPGGEENDILNRHLDLVDEGFVQVCELVAAQLQGEGEENQAAFLRDWAREVGALLRPWETQKNTPPEKYLQLLRGLLKVETESHSDPKVVYPFLLQHQALLDLQFAEILTQWFRSKLDPNQQKHNFFLAALLNSIAVDISEFPLGRRADTLEIAITCYEAALEVRTPSACPKDWAMTQNNLAGVYLYRLRGERAENLERAISYYEAALQVYTPSTYPEDWAMTQNNLGNAHLYRLRGERAENLERAISYYEAALQVYTPSTYPEDWAMTQNNLAGVYLYRLRGERAENLERAISYYEVALSIYTPSVYPEDWAMTQNNLGNAHLYRLRGERAENLERAISCYEAALQVYTPSTYPEDWAMMQNNLGNAYLDRLREERAENLERAISYYERAISYYEAALQVYPPSPYAEKWAMTQNNLGEAYRNRLRGERAENLERAISCYEAALSVRTRSAFPEDWAMTQNNLGSAHLDRLRGERAENLERAISYYEAALSVYTRSAYAEKWAMTQNNLGEAYRNRLRGERGENLEQAISHYEAALSVYIRSAYAEDWAMTQNNLGNAYSDRLRGERAENLEQGISHYEAALSVYTRSAYSEYWAMTQNNLGTAYWERLRGERAENLERAISCYEAALEVRTRIAYPEKWAETQNNLGAAYSDCLRGERAENLEQAISCYEAALEVRTRTAYPEYWAETQNNLGTAYSDRLRGEWAENLEWAISCYRESLEVRTSEALPLECLKTGRNLGNLGYKIQNWEIAIEGYNQAILAIEQSRYWAISEATKRELIANSLDIYQKMVQACINHQDYAQALLTVERSKSRTLIELLDSAHLYPKNATDAQKQRISDLRRQIAIYQQQLAFTPNDTLTPATEKHPNQPSPETLIRQQLQAANQQFQDLLTELDDPNFTLTQQVPAQLPDLRRLLQPQTALIEWYLPTEADSGFYLFLVTRRRDEQIQITPHHFSATDRQHLDQALLDYRSDYGQPTWNDQLPQRLETLSAALQLPRILAKLSQIQHLILIPHRELHLIPLHALPVSLPSPSGNEGKPLQDWFPVQYAPSCQILNNLQQRPPLNRETVPFFAIQNPTNKNNLAYAELAVELLLRQFSPHQVLRRDQATLDNFTQPHTQTFLEQSHAVHFGCHGEFDDDNPLNAYLRLANGDKLTFLDIFNRLNIPLCRLLVLSACKTGLVETSRTDDYVGLSSAFFYAGARTVVASLWNVDELAATLVTLRLYQILPDYPSVAVALQAAQTWLRGVSCDEILDWLKHEQKATEEEVEEVEDRLDLFEDDPPFANAYYWSAFTATGL